MFQDLSRKAVKILTDNAPAILTGVGAFGTVSTAVLSSRASFKAAELIRSEDIAYRNAHDGHGQLDSKDKVKLVWPLYVPAVGTGAVSVACIIMAHRVSANQLAAMATLYGLSEGRFQEYKDKVTETIGVSKEGKIHDAVAQDQVTNNPPGEVLVIGSGDVLCLDRYSGRYFRSSVDAIKKAENALNHCISQHDYADLTSFYLDIGLPKTGYSDEVGWNSANPLDVRYTTALSADESQPCIAIDFISHPRSDFHQTY